MKFLALVVLCFVTTGALIYARIWNPGFIPFQSSDTNNNDKISWQENAWKEYQQLSKKYESPIALAGTLADLDSSKQQLNQNPVPFQIALDKETYFYQLGEWCIVRQDSISLIIDHNEKTITAQIIPDEWKQPINSPIIPNILGLPASLIRGITSKAEKNGLKSITLILQNAEIEKIQIFYDPATGYLTDATIWQNQLLALSDQYEPDDSLQLNVIREFEWDYEVSGDSSNTSLKAFFAQRISKLTYQNPTSIENIFRPLDRYISFKDGLWQLKDEFKNYQFAIK